MENLTFDRSLKSYYQEPISFKISKNLIFCYFPEKLPGHNIL